MRSSAAAHIEGIPTATIVDEQYMQVARMAYRGMRVGELPLLTIPKSIIRKPEGSDPEEIRQWAEANIDKIVEALTRWEPKVKQGFIARPERKLTVEGEDYQYAVDNMNNLFLENRWGDGLPLVPPTEQRVNWLLTGTELPRDAEIAKVEPSGAICTPEVVAVNAAMAGARPEYMPVIIAVMKAITRDEFELTQLQTTTNPVAPAVVVNGPIAKQLGINSSYGCLGPSPEFPAGASIGRAIRFLLMNVGGAIPGVVDMATIGQPGKYTGLVFAEAEELLPPGWNPLNVEMGFARGTNTVTCYGVSGTTNMHNASAGKGAKCAPLAIANFLKAPNANYLWSLSRKGGKFGLLVISAPTDRIMRKGFENFDSKDAIKRFLYENVKISPEDAMTHWNKDYIMSRTHGLHKWPVTEPITARGPEDFMIACIGPAMDLPFNHWTWMGCGHGGFAPITEEIKLPVNWNELLKAAPGGPRR